jgi:drug/metabolite transporter (DMT)-like permease
VFVAVRYVVEVAPPFLSIGARYVVSGLVLALWVVSRGGSRRLALNRRTALGCLLLAVLLPVLSNGLVSWALSRGLTAAPAALLGAMTPIWVVVLQAANRDRPSAATAGGVLVGFAGVAVLLLGGASTGALPLPPALVVVLCAGCWALGSYLQPRLPLPPYVAAVTAWEMLFGGLILTIVGAAAGEPLTASFPLGTWLALGYLTTSSVVAFSCYTWLLTRASLSLVSTHAYVNPVVAAALGVALLGEPVTWPVVLGGAVVLVAVALIVGVERP